MKRGGGGQERVCEARATRRSPESAHPQKTPGMSKRGRGHTRGTTRHVTFDVRHGTPPPTRSRYGKVPNEDGPYAHCGVGKAVACTQHMEMGSIALVRQRVRITPRAPQTDICGYNWANKNN